MEFANSLDYGRPMQDDEFKIWVYKASEPAPLLLAHNGADAAAAPAAHPLLCRCNFAKTRARCLAPSAQRVPPWRPRSIFWQPGPGRDQSMATAIAYFSATLIQPRPRCSQVLPCPNKRQHDWKRCPLAHAGRVPQACLHRALQV
jgi:hypothetical protein